MLNSRIIKVNLECMFLLLKLDIQIVVNIFNISNLSGSLTMCDLKILLDEIDIMCSH